MEYLLRIQVDCHIVIKVGNEYRFDSPGIVCEAFSQFRGTNVGECIENFASYSHQKFDYFFTNDTRLYDLLDEIAGRMDFHNENDFFHKIVSPAFFTQSRIMYIDNQELLLQELCQRLSLGQNEQLFLVFSGDAGEVFRNEDAGFRYFFRSHEGNHHNIPHVHVNFEHEYDASFSLKDGAMIAGNMPSKQQKRVKQKIMENQETLVEQWNEQTDGIRFDLDYLLGSIAMEKN